MNTRNRRRVEMGTRVLASSTAHPDASPGFVAAVGRLTELLQRSAELDTQQRDGQITVRSATARKRDLRRQMRRAHLEHLSQVARAAADDVPELARKFILNRKATPYLAFRTAARGMQAEALGQKDVLVKHGLTDTVLDDLAKALDEFDQALAQGAEGRRAHVGASAELDSVADEIVQIVRVLDGLNRVRFEHDAELMAAWESASNVFGGPRVTGGRTDPGENPAPGGEQQPAA